MPKKEKKVYKKYEAKKDSNFHSDNRGYNARPNYFQTKYMSYFWTRIHNPFRIRDWKNFDKRPDERTDFEKSFHNAKQWFDKQTHESMTRDTMSNKDFNKILPFKS